MENNEVPHAGAAADRATGRPNRGRRGRGRRGRPRRAVALACLVAAAALGLAACGSGTSGPKTGGTASTNAAIAKPVKFARCMRAHGLTSFPDPVPAPGGGYSFHLRVTPGSPLNEHSAQFKAAETACKAFSVFGSLTPAQQVVANAKALKYSQCMRAHGISGYPDPNGKGTIVVAAGNGIAPTSPRFQQAQRACQRLDNGFNMDTSNFPS